MSERIDATEAYWKDGRLMYRRCVTCKAAVVEPPCPKCFPEDREMRRIFEEVAQRKDSE